MDAEKIEKQIRQLLASRHLLVAFANADLIVGENKEKRILALVEVVEEGTIATDLISFSNEKTSANDFSSNETALLIFKLSNQSDPCSSGLSLETILPIDARFQCHVGGSTVTRTENVLQLTLSSSAKPLCFEMSFGQKTSNFVSEVLKAAEGVTKGTSPGTEWLMPYLVGGSGPLAAASQSSEALSDGSSGIFTIDTVSSSNWESTASQSTRSTDSPQQQPFSVSQDIHLHFADSCSLDSTDRATLCNSGRIHAARETHVKHEMSKREGSYTHKTTLTFFVGTFNVNGMSPCEGLAPWLASDKDPPDVYALGFQELDLATEAYIFTSSNKETEWRQAVTCGLHPAAKYREVRCVRLVGIMLLVLVQEKHCPNVSEVEFSIVPCGIMNMIGNKGGVSLRMNLYNTSICFVNCHLAADPDQMQRRNEDYDCISEKTKFGYATYIRDHNQIFFFGDMNYRLMFPGMDVRQLASEEQYQLLLKVDQLNMFRKNGRIFKGYKEGEIKFRPTYKYDRFSNNWDSSEKKRDPAWCDRILWSGEGIAQTCYRSHHDITLSDHKPVSALFKSQVNVIDPAKYRIVHEEVMKLFDKLENDCLPQVSLSTTEIKLQPVHFMESQKATLTISNTGQISVQFAFIEKLHNECCKPWLSIQPISACIIPGEDCVVNLEVNVDKDTINAIRDEKGRDDVVEDILVLHLEGGKDFFITVTGEYVRSCFGTSINALVHMNKPFKEVPVAQLIDLESSSPKNVLELPYAVPKELWYLMDHLFNHGLDTEGLFSDHQGSLTEFRLIRAALDEGCPSGSLPGSPHSAAVALVIFLEALPEPVVPFALHQEALLAATQDLPACKKVLDKVPDYHRNVFTYVVAFLQELLAHREQNKIQTSDLAMVFGMIMLRESTSKRSAPLSSELKQFENNKNRRQQFLLKFLLDRY